MLKKKERKEVEEGGGEREEDILLSGRLLHRREAQLRAVSNFSRDNSGQRYRRRV